MQGEYERQWEKVNDKALFTSREGNRGARVTLLSWLP